MSVPTISFDPKKCIECGACARDCINAVIVLDGGKPLAKRPEHCNLCSHCAAVCPSGAVIHSGLGPARELNRKLIDPAAYRETVLARRSVRHYKPEPVPKEDLDDILDLARHSPTASNTMDVGYLVITDPAHIDRIGRRVFRAGEKMLAKLNGPLGPLLVGIINLFLGGRGIGRYVERIGIYREWLDAGRNPVTHNAPCLIIIHGPARGRFVRENCAIAAANIANYATAKGLGSCYIGLLVALFDRKKRWAAELGVPPGRRAWLALTLGKPAVHHRNAAARPPADAVFQP
jgi:nitroreductase/NAD-dependent dihydropyrimidine dehydrogenase PreA subunit